MKCSLTKCGGSFSQGNMMWHCCSGVCNCQFFQNRLVISPSMHEGKAIAIKSINNWNLWRHVPTIYICDRNDCCSNLRQTWHLSNWVQNIPNIFLSLRQWPADQNRYTVASWIGPWTLWLAYVQQWCSQRLYFNLRGLWHLKFDETKSCYKNRMMSKYSCSRPVESKYSAYSGSQKHRYSRCVSRI